MKIANMLVQHNIPLDFANHLSPVMNDIFKGSATACDYLSARTKTAWNISSLFQKCVGIV